MSGIIEVLQPGLYSSIQDRGRFGFQKFGVPLSGVMDEYSMKICNLLLGNDPNSPVLEFTFQGPHLRFLGNTKISICGAEFKPLLNDTVIELNQVHTVSKNDELKFQPSKNGLRGYLGIKGGFITEKVMDSFSWYEGITENSRLSKGDELKFKTQQQESGKGFASIKFDSSYLETSNVEVFPGPDWDSLPKKLKEDLLRKKYTVDQNSNRMATRLKEKLENNLKQIITGPVIPGTVQFTPAGDLIVLGKDCQTTGGYPRILQLSEKGMQALFQKIPGKNFQFKLVE